MEYILTIYHHILSNDCVAESDKCTIPEILLSVMIRFNSSV
jgi:hypothetical protein